jgi:hypothetical protein
MHTDMQSKYHADARQPFLHAPKPDEDLRVEWRLLQFVLLVIVAVLSSGSPLQSLNVFAF